MLRSVLLASIILAQLAYDCSIVTDDIVSEGLGRQLDGHLSRAALDGFSGVALVAQRDGLILRKGYGHADATAQRPFRPETAFDIGSITKHFTAAAILKLEMAGKLATTDTISKFFAGVPDDKKTITLHHLLTHTAGLQSDFGGDYEVMSRDQIVGKALASKLKSGPGERHYYSNAGYSLLAAIVEIVSGQSYETYLREQIFEPAAMPHTGYRLPKWGEIEVAYGIRFGQDWGSPLAKRWADDGPYWNLRGNGGLMSTVDDMYRWHQLLSTDKVLSQEARTKMFTPHVPESPGAKGFYGYGWAITKTDRGTTLIWHNGGNGVFYAVVRRYVDEDTVMILASNNAQQSVQKQESALARIIFPPTRTN